MPDQNSDEATIQPLSRSLFVQNVLPFLTSLAFHAGLLVLGFVVYQSVKAMTHETLPPAPIDMPYVLQGLNTDPTPLPGIDPTVRTTVIQHNVETDATGISMDHGSGRTTNATLGAKSNDDASANSFIGTGTAGLVGSGPNGTGVGEGGPLAPFGVAHPGGGSNLFPPGHGPAPRSVVFLCDASGSMLNKFENLRNELNKAVRHLKPSQSFGITFFGDGRSNGMASQLVMATPENQVRANVFLEGVSPRGTTDPLPAIELAFRQKPKLIFLLTDGDFPDNDVVLNRIRQLNKDHLVAINTIAFVSEADTDTAFIALLKKIADENGGAFKHVTPDQIP